MRMSSKEIRRTAKEILGEELLGKVEKQGFKPDDVVSMYHDLDRDGDELKERFESLFGNDKFQEFISLQDKVITSLRNEIKVRRDLKKGVIQDYIKGDIGLDQFDNIEDSL